MAVKILEDVGTKLTSAKRQDLIAAIQAASGRTVVGETVTFKQSLVDGVSNVELLKSWGADMVTINHYNVDMPMIPGMSSTEEGLAKFAGCWNVEKAQGCAADPKVIEPVFQKNYLQFGFGRTINDVKRLAGVPVGITLEPVDEDSDYPYARIATEENARKAVEQGANYVIIVQTPSMSEERFIDCTKEVRKGVGEDGLVIVGKMPWGGSFLKDAEEYITSEIIQKLADAGADVIMVPSPGTVPGLTVELVHRWVSVIHACGLLAETTIGTSQEGSEVEVLRRFAIDSKMAGADIFQVGDSAYGGVTTPENMMSFAMSIKGRRHTLRRMAVSPLRGM